jgi:hypothetical protein
MVNRPGPAATSHHTPGESARDRTKSSDPGRPGPPSDRAVPSRRSNGHKPREPRQAWTPDIAPKIGQMDLFESVSTWRQPLPPASSAERSALIAEVAGQIVSLGPGRLRVAVDALTASGKSSFGHELAAELRERKRPVMRASLDDFKHPWRHAREHGYDRLSGEGYYRNPWDFASARDLLGQPAGPAGSGVVALCAHADRRGPPRHDGQYTPGHDPGSRRRIRLPA